MVLPIIYAAAPALSSKVNTSRNLRGLVSVAERVGGRCVRYLTDICRNNSRIRWTNVPALGVRAWGDITMADSDGWNERRNQVARYRVMEHETTDPLAARLLHDIVLDLEAEFEGSPQSVGLMLVAPS
jgi:hypothetical protein